MSLPYYNCDNASESYKFPLRKGMAQFDGDVGVRCIIQYIPNEQLSSIQCDEYKSIAQLYRQALVTDENGNTALRFFVGL